MPKITFACLLICLLAACTEVSVPAVQGRFVLHDSDRTGVGFRNTITETDSLNYFNFPYMYLGAGVAAADFDRDGLTDLLFTGNMVPNKLYRNLGDFRFEDVSAASGLGADARWHTGVTVVDINDDGWPDVYVSVAGKGGDQRNQLYVNKGADAGAGIVFEEQGAAYGLADPGPSVQAAFFDYDHDGDLDCFVINYPPAPFSSSNRYYKEQMKAADPLVSDHLYRNNGNGTFSDVSAEAGVANYGLSLGLSVADFNDDGYEDLYVSNDFSTPDRYFENNGDGTFTDRLTEAFAQTALFGMGCDAADYNNDGRMDLVQADMTPGDNRRAKENMASMNVAAFDDMIRRGFHYQYMYNALQLNQGSDAQRFANAAQLAGVAATDWSWAPLLADFDNDGYQDLFITNGIKREVNNRDFHNALKIKVNFGQTLDVVNFRDIPSEPVANFAFRNDGDLSFSDKSADWGLDLKGFSNGATYADLDNDGDLDLAVSNVDGVAAVYENRLSANKSLSVELAGPAGNRLGFGAKVTVSAGELTQTRQLSVTRGFQSAVSPVLSFGLGQNDEAAQLSVTWPDGRVQHLTRVPAGKVTLEHAKASAPPVGVAAPPTFFSSLAAADWSVAPLRHRENDYNDYQLEPLLPYKTSQLGPCLSTGDVNGDGREDLFLGGAYGQAGQLLLQQANGRLAPLPGPWAADSSREDTGSALFDADGDGDLDLYVVSGGNEFFRRPDFLQDRLYLNNGAGHFQPATLPLITASGSCVRPADLDGDGDLDLFVGGRIVPGEYPLPARSYLLLNDGQGGFSDATEKLAPELTAAGLVTDASWADSDGDGRPDLFLTGEWMPVRHFRNTATGFVEQEDETLAANVGWFQSLQAADFDGDGDPDLIAGNLGRNYKYHASPYAPFTVHSGDFDNNKRRDIVLGYHQDGELFPLRGRQCSAEQIPALEYKFRDYESFAAANLTEIYGERNLENALYYAATNFASLYFENRGADGWAVRELPVAAQLSAVQDLLVEDFDGDGHKDVLLAGNLYQAEVETPRADAGRGLLLFGDGAGNFRPLPAAGSGLALTGDVKSLARLNAGGKDLILAGRNDDSVLAVRYSSTLNTK